MSFTDNEVKVYFNKVVTTRRRSLGGGRSEHGLDYVFIEGYGSKSTQDIIVLLTGFGSGWEGIVELGCAYVAKGHNVFLISPPGCGESAIPQLVRDSENLYETYAHLINLALLECFPDDYERMNFKIVAHSAGALIAVEMAKVMSIKNMMLISPSGFTQEGIMSYLTLPLKFAFSGIEMRINCQEEYEKRFGVLRRQRSAFLGGRFLLRLRELGDIIRFKYNSNPLGDRLRLIVLFGRHDGVYQCRNLSESSTRIVIMPKWYHNPTIPHTREVVDEWERHLVDQRPQSLS